MQHNPLHPEPTSATPGALRMLGLSVFLAVGLIGLLFAGHFAYQFRTLARQSDPPQATHGLVFPASAVVTRHKVEPDVVRLDGGATTQLELPAADLPAFLAQLNVRQTVTPPTGPQAFDPGWMQTRYECASPTGDALQVDVGDPTQPTLRVRVYTNWN